MIDKFADEEIKSLIKTHSSLLFAWANAHQGLVSPKAKEALLNTTARLYELVEAIPTTKGPIISGNNRSN